MPGFYRLTDAGFTALNAEEQDKSSGRRAQKNLHHNGRGNWPASIPWNPRNDDAPTIPAKKRTGPANSSSHAFFGTVSNDTATTISVLAMGPAWNRPASDARPLTNANGHFHIRPSTYPSVKVRIPPPISAIHASDANVRVGAEAMIDRMASMGAEQTAHWPTLDGQPLDDNPTK